MKRGFSLVETMIVVLIFTFLFAGILTVLAMSDRSWRIGQNKLIEQQEARKAMDGIIVLLRQSSPEWGVYISTTQDRIQFSSKPIINADSTITKTRILFKLDPNNLRQLIKQVGTDTDWIPVAQEIQSIKFSGGDCAGCNCNFTNPACATCINVTNNCPLVKIEITTQKEQTFSLVSYVTLRNTSLPGAETPELPAEGEFQ